MAEAQFASLNGTAVYAATTADDEFDFDFQPNPNAIARRSISIFSRRGTETPEPTPPFIAQAAMARAPAQRAKRGMTERQKSWLGRRRSVIGSSSPGAEPEQKKPKGTILNAVPPAKIIQMTPLEEEMATSPNEEILSAVSGERSPTQTAFTARSHQSLDRSPSQQTAGFWNRSPTSGAQRTKSEKRKDTQSRIGIWVNGVAQWDDHLPLRNPHDQHTLWVEEAIKEETGFSPLHPGAAPSKVHPALRGQKPSLSVIIPGGEEEESKAHTMALSTIVQPRPQRPVVSVAPASIVSKFNMATPAIVLTEEHGEEHDVSPIESMQHTPPPEPATRFSDDQHLEVLSPETLRSKPSRESSSSAGSSMLEQDDKSSVYSKRSSATSIEALPIPLPKRSSKRLSGRALSRSKESSPAPAPRHETVDLNKPLPPDPHPLPTRSAPPLPARIGRSFSTYASRPTARSEMRQRPTSSIQIRSAGSIRSLSHLDSIDPEFSHHSSIADDLEIGNPSYDTESTETEEEDEPITPTLSQAEQELRAHLDSRPSEEGHEIIQPETTGSEVQRADSILGKTASMRRNGSVHSVMQPPARAPTVPRRSRKREWRASRMKSSEQVIPAPVRRKSESSLYPQTKTSVDASTTQVRRALSAAQLTTVKTHGEYLDVPNDARPQLSEHPTLAFDDGLIVLQGPTILSDDAAFTEDVLLHILAALCSTEDLFNTALINKGMYRVFKENEMRLITTVTYNQSPAAWELREWSPPEREQSDSSSKASSQLEHTPQSYLRCQRRDTAVIESLKGLILAECQTFIRRETAFALSTPTHPNAQRFNDAFWRIWCFCKIFGCEKNREDDVTGQLDWLKGGLLANGQDCVATVNTNLEFEMSSVLLNPPEYFAKGNAGGLTAQQLYDVTEVWCCLCALLQGYSGRVDQARDAGVFDACLNIDEDDVEREEQMLDEWLAHLLTLGPSVVLEMAEHFAESTAAGFALAKLNGWTRWTPPTYTGSRTTFLKEPVSRLYEERVAAIATALENPRERELKEMSRKRVATLAAEIKLKRQSSNYKRSPYIDMRAERAMSVVSRRSSTMSTSTRSSQRMLVSPMTPGPQYFNSSSAVTPVSAVPNFSHSHAHPSATPHSWSHARKISPIIEERVENFNRLSLQNILAGESEDTSDKAVRSIVDMGFTAAQAKEALRKTDLGDGLRVDRAVEYLLRQRM